MSGDKIDLPWKPERTRQVEGGVTERAIAKERGARAHPRSGAGKIKWDASDVDSLYEIKDANESHTVKGTYLRSLLREAVRQGKEAIYIVNFQKAGIQIECRVRRSQVSPDGFDKSSDE